MAIQAFPPHEYADDDGFLALGGDLEIESLLLAYTSGIFPWPMSPKLPLTWFSPPKRAILFFKDLHISLSLKKDLKRALKDTSLELWLNRSTSQVIKNCAKSPHRRGQAGTWIIPSMAKAYTNFAQAGFCSSIECYQDNKLVGGLYGVSINSMFAGESMFYLKDGASKLCLITLVAYLKQKGLKWIDCQMLTPLFKSFGAIEVGGDDYLKLLQESIAKKVRLFPLKAEQLNLAKLINDFI